MKNTIFTEEKHMKKFVSFILVCAMLTAMFIIPVNAAKDPFGTVVEVPYTKTAPSMEAAAPDASWGDKIITVDKNTKNAGLIDYVNSYANNTVPKVRDDIKFDLYARWTDTTLYLCFVSPDKEITGAMDWYAGDGIQMVVYPGIMDVSYCNNVSCGWTNENEYYEFDWTATVDFDDESTSTSIKAEDRAIVYIDDRNVSLVVKFEMPFNEIGFGKKEVIGDGTYVSFAMIRGDKSFENTTNVDDGMLEWGDFYDAQKGWDPSDELRYNRCCNIPSTTTANTFKMVGKGAGATTPTQQEDPTPLKGAPSVWAEAEVKKAIEAGLVPEALQNNYTSGISRANLSKCLSALLDKVYGKAPEKNDAKFNDTTDADVLKAANLGIINGYDVAGGTKDFKPNNTLKRSEMSAIINRVAKLCGKTVEGFDSEVKFSDTASHWCNKELGWPVHNGIVKGTSATTFSPENTLTVEQTIMMIYRTYTALK